MKELRIKVRYKSNIFILQPGHKVYECNTDTGIVKEHKLKKSFFSILFFWTDPVFDVTYKKNIIHRPFYNSRKAGVEFNNMLKPLIAERKKEGKTLIISHE